MANTKSHKSLQKLRIDSQSAAQRKTKQSFKHSPNDIQQVNVPIIDRRYTRRLPTVRTTHNNITLARRPTKPIHTVAKLGLIGTPYACMISVMNGRIAYRPENCAIRNMSRMSSSGFSVRLRVISPSFCRNVGGGCVQMSFCFTHGLHEPELTLYRCNCWNSFATACGGVQPRSHCNDFSASSSRPFDNSHRGVSGICNWMQR